MTSVRRSKAMPTDSPTAKFLYTIIKQLDLKCIDWNLVASQLEISNGHAARMRYSRFRQQMEGISSVSRGPRGKNSANKSAKRISNSGKGDQQKEVTTPPPQMIKQEPGGPSCEPSPYIKAEPYGGPIPNLAEIPQVNTHTSPALQTHPSSHQYPQMGVANFGHYSHAPSLTPVPVPFERCTLWEPIKAESHPEPEQEREEHGTETMVKMELAPGEVDSSIGG